MQDEPAPKSASDRDIQVILKKEAERILSAIPKESIVAVLTPEGEMPDSPGFAKLIGGYNDMGKSLCFVIGGSYGIDADIKKLAKHKISFSRLTFPHRLFRVMLEEQIYRAFKIINGEEYHK